MSSIITFKSAAVEKKKYKNNIKAHYIFLVEMPNCINLLAFLNRIFGDLINLLRTVFTTKIILKKA